MFDEGDWLFLYTDGVTDSEEENGEPFGVERLQELLVAASGSGLDGVVARVEQAVREYRGGKETADDATLVALRIGVNAAVSFSASFDRLAISLPWSPASAAEPLPRPRGESR